VWCDFGLHLPYSIYGIYFIPVSVMVSEAKHLWLLLAPD
jgi:hypothetical protein